jgi:glutathione S-transferase
MSCDLWYWTGIPGRGEFVRLALEAGRIPYRDRAREDGDDALVADMKARAPLAPFAPPYLVVDGVAIAQVANILLYLGERHDLAPTDSTARLWLHQIQLTITDFIAEVHQLHHPSASASIMRIRRPKRHALPVSFVTSACRSSSAGWKPRPPRMTESG